MDALNCIRQRRTIRLFLQDPIKRETLLDFVDLARLSPSGANRQPLEYLIVDDDTLKNDLFAQLAWAAYVQPKRTPPTEKRPIAYIIVLINKDVASDNICLLDAGAAIQTILLAAQSKGIGSCWLGSIHRDKISKIFGIPDNYDINSVVALGYPAENPLSEDAQGAPANIRYYLDENDNLHVPKRSVSKITHLNKF